MTVDVSVTDGEENRGTLSSPSTAMVNATEVLGEKLDPMPPMYQIVLHALMHKPLLLLSPAVPAALAMVASSWFPHCSITEDELPFVPFLPGVNSRWAEWLMMRLVYAIGFIFMAAGGPGALSLNLLDTQAYMASFIMISAPWAILTIVIVSATQCSSSNLGLVIYLLPMDSGVCLSCILVLYVLGSNRLRGVDGVWWKPSTLLRRGFVDVAKDVFGYLLLCCSVTVAIVYIAIDLCWVAPNPTVAPYRPLFSLALKKVCYITFSQSLPILGDSYRVWGLVCVSTCMGLNTAFAAVQCRSWPDLFTFILADCAAFLLRIWCHSGMGNSNTCGYYLRRYCLLGKAGPPAGVAKPVYRGWEIVVEGLGVSIGFTAMVVLYFLSDPSLSPYPMLRQMCFPSGAKSFQFLLVMFVADFLQDISGVVWVAYKVGHDFEPFLGHPFARRNRPFLLCVFTQFWALLWMVQFGWLFQRLQVGPFSPSIGSGSG